MAAPLQYSKAAAWLNYQVEKEGIARLTIFILLLTTVGMLSYTWGYAEGVHNSQTNMAEEIRLGGPSSGHSELKSISELRHTSSTQQQLGPPPNVSVQSLGHSAAPSEGSLLTPEELKLLNASFDSSSSSSQQQHHQVPDPPLATGALLTDIQAAADELNASGQGGSSSSTADSVLQPLSRAADGSEDDLLGAGQLTVLDNITEDYGG